MRFQPEETSHGFELNITPMIDIIFLLIIFFMTVAQFSNLETEEIKLPVADEAKIEGSEEANRILINVRENGEIVVSKRTVSIKELGLLLKSEAEKYKDSKSKGASDLAVLVRADGEVSFSKIQRLMLECAKAGIWKLSFAALKEEPKRNG